MFVSSPWRRCVGLTETQVTPAVGSEAPPGTVISNEKIPVVLTISSPSKPASVRSYSQSAFVFAVSVGSATGAPKPMKVAVTKVSNSSRRYWPDLGAHDASSASGKEQCNTADLQSALQKLRFCWLLGELYLAGGGKIGGWRGMRA